VRAALQVGLREAERGEDLLLLRAAAELAASTWRDSVVNDIVSALLSIPRAFATPPTATPP
jgi:hypothetical protein